MMLQMQVGHMHRDCSFRVDAPGRNAPASAFKVLFEFTRMPFGLCNVPATFQRVMQYVLAGLEWKSCFVHIDDILVASKTFDEHLKHLHVHFLHYVQHIYG